MSYFGPFHAARRAVARAEERRRAEQRQEEQQRVLFTHPDLLDVEASCAYWYPRGTEA